MWASDGLEVWQNKAVKDLLDTGTGSMVQVLNRKQDSGRSPGRCSRCDGGGCTSSRTTAGGVVVLLKQRR